MRVFFRKNRSIFAVFSCFVILGLFGFAHSANASGENDFSKKGTATFEVIDSTDHGEKGNQGANNPEGGEQAQGGAKHKQLPRTNMLQSFGLSFVGGLLVIFAGSLYWSRRRKNEEK